MLFIVVSSYNLRSGGPIFDPQRGNLVRYMVDVISLSTNLTNGITT